LPGIARREPHEAAFGPNRRLETSSRFDLTGDGGVKTLALKYAEDALAGPPSGDQASERHEWMEPGNRSLGERELSLDGEKRDEGSG
jgi:hypothetical protein